MRVPSMSTIGLFVLLTVGRGSSPASGEDFHLELARSVLFEDSIDESTVSLRGSLPMSDRFRVEGRLGRLDTGSLEIWILDASIQFVFDDRGRAHWYLTGGPGTSFESLGELADGRLLLHVGVGTRIRLARRLYLRPEILARWVETDLETAGGDVSLGLGWRF